MPPRAPGTHWDHSPCLQERLGERVRHVAEDALHKGEEVLHKAEHAAEELLHKAEHAVEGVAHKVAAGRAVWWCHVCSCERGSKTQAVGCACCTSASAAGTKDCRTRPSLACAQCKAKCTQFRSALVSFRGQLMHSTLTPLPQVADPLLHAVHERREKAHEEAERGMFTAGKLACWSAHHVCNRWMHLLSAPAQMLPARGGPELR